MLQVGVVLDATTVRMVRLILTMLLYQVRLLSWYPRWRRSFSTRSVQLAGRYRDLRQLSQIVQLLRDVALHFLNHLDDALFNVRLPLLVWFCFDRPPHTETVPRL